MALNDLKKILDAKITNASSIFITPHINADYDALASSIAMSIIIKKLGKDSYFIMNDDILKMDWGMKTIFEETKAILKPISPALSQQLMDKNSLLIAMDMNGSHLTACKPFLAKFSQIIVIDHHNVDENTIISAEKYIDTTVSSTAEILTNLCQLYKIKITPQMADYLLAGIYLDTNKFTQNVSCKTMETVVQLMKNGGNMAQVNRYFEEDYLTDRKVLSLVLITQFITYNPYTIALAIDNSDIIYTKGELARVADYLLKYRDIEVTLAAGKISDDIMAISARSKGKVDVSKLMHEMGGGGNNFSAAACINVEQKAQNMAKILLPKFYK